MHLLIIGSGIAGLAAAIMAERQGHEVTLLTKRDSVLDSASSLAQGGIAYEAEAEAAEGDAPSLQKDVEFAGDGLCLKNVVKWVAEQGPQVVREFLIDDLKVPFAKDDGKLVLTKEAAHTKSRILFADDNTGRVLVEALWNRIEALRPNKVNVLTGTTAIELITLPHHSTDPLSVYEKARCLGAYVMNVRSNEVQKIFADKVVLATGGIGNLYEHTTNPSWATGDGIALGYRAGARVINMEFTQFHPTTLAVKGRKSHLLSETLRGEGGLIVNEAGEDIMRRYHPKGSLAPRDVVSQSMTKYLLQSGEEQLYLSLTHCKHINLKKRFPNLYELCLKYKLDMAKERIPITPAFHYSCGGLLTDLQAKTTVKNLFAIGEVACTGLHGANRLASMSLLEGVVFARQAVLANVKENVHKSHVPFVADWSFPESDAEADPIWVRQKWKHIRSLMWHYAGVVRKRDSLQQAIHELQHQKNLIENVYRKSLLSPQMVELRNGIQTAILVALSALKNPKSQGCHYIA